MNKRWKDIPPREFSKYRIKLMQKFSQVTTHIVSYIIIIILFQLQQNFDYIFVNVCDEII